MRVDHAYEKVKATDTGLNSIAVWQFAAFLILLLLVWANEIFDFAHLLYSRERTPPDYFRASILSAFVVTTAIVTVGHTFLMQTRILSGFMVVCSYCHKVKIERQAWKTIEGYISEHSEVTFSHGVCPECYEEQIRTLGEEHAKTGSNKSSSSA